VSFSILFGSSKVLISHILSEYWALLLFWRRGSPVW